MLKTRGTVPRGPMRTLTGEGIFTMSHAIRMLVAATAVGGLALSGLMTAGAASAAINGPGTHGPGSWYFHPGSGSHAIGVSTATPTSSRTFAGYQATVPAGSATVLTASFTAPALSCTTADRAIAPSTGVPVNNYKTVSAAFLFTGCVNGTAVYFPGLVVNGTETDYTASPFAAGDVINLTTKVSTNRTRVQVTDVTTGVTQKIIGPGARASAAFVGDEAWLSSSGALMRVPDFGKVQFKNCLLDGKTLASWRPKAYQRVTSLGVVQISTGAFWPGGTAFTTRYMHR
jgi:Peptidase A4 family